MIASGSWGFIELYPCYLRYPIIVSNAIVQIQKIKRNSHLSTFLFMLFALNALK